MKGVIRFKRNRDEYKYLICSSVLLLYLQYLKFMPFRGLYDDLVALQFIFVITINHKKIRRSESIILMMLMIMLILAIISNYAQGFVTNITYMANDAYSFMRIFFVFVGVTILCRDNYVLKRDIIKAVSSFGKAFILISFVFGVLTEIGLTNMYERIRFGIKCYTFIFQNASQYGIMVGCALGFVLLNNSKRSRLFEFMGCAVLIMTGKGMSLIIATVYIAFIIINKIGLRTSIISFAVISVLLSFVLRFQIVRYLLDSTAPRSLFLRYGFLTGLRFFPFGSGLATFGSNMAAVHYSPLYLEYGFREIKALSGTSEKGLAFMNDVYLGMILAEFGFIGVILLIGIFVKIFLRIWKRYETEKKKKYIVVACFISACGMAIMAGSLKNAPGEMIFLLSAIYVAGAGNNVRNKINKSRIVSIRKKGNKSYHGKYSSI